MNIASILNLRVSHTILHFVKSKAEYNFLYCKKALISVLIAILILICLFCIFGGYLAVFAARRQLENVFPQSRVSIGGYVFKPFSSIAFLDIKISRPEIYDFKIKEARIDYSLPSILKGRIPAVSLRNLALDIRLREKNLREFRRYLRLGSKKAFSPLEKSADSYPVRKFFSNGVRKRNSLTGFILERLDLVDLNIRLYSRELKASAALSLNLDLENRLINYLDLKIHSVDSRQLYLEDAFFTIKNTPNAGNLSVKKISYAQLKIAEITSRLKLEDSNLFLNDFSAKLFGGRLEGNFYLTGKDITYGSSLKLTDLNIEDLINDYELKNKFWMSGRLGGEISFKGRGFRMESLSGRLNSLIGGSLVITDNSLLRTIASSSRQPLDIIVESFRDYRYNTAMMDIAKEGDDLILSAALEGQAGSRNLNITVHNFNLENLLLLIKSGKI